MHKKSFNKRKMGYRFLKVLVDMVLAGENMF